MKLKRYKQIFEDDSRHWDDDIWSDEDDYISGYNIRKDENSWMNDKLDKNKSSFRDEEEYDYDDDSTKYDDEDEDISQDDMQHLLYLLRSMFRNSGIEDVEVTNQKMDITITCKLRRKERLKDLIKVFEIAKKLKKDILAQYDSEVEMFDQYDKHEKQSRPQVEFSFLYDEGLYDDESPF
jgi:hypothetical protein